MDINIMRMLVYILKESHATVFFADGKKLYEIAITDGIL